MSMNHVPTPWRVFHSGSDGPRILPNTGNMREDIKYIAIVNGRDFQTDAANAEFIVRAANAHEDLLELAKYVRAHFQNSDDTPRHHLPHSSIRLLNMAHEVIKKAEGI